MFVKTRAELLENQMKQYNWEQDQIAHMKVRPTYTYYEVIKQLLNKYNKIFRTTSQDLVTVAPNWLVKLKAKRKHWRKWSPVA